VELRVPEEPTTKGDVMIPTFVKFIVCETSTPEGGVIVTPALKLVALKFRV
jgi:hypothetical protein